MSIGLLIPLCLVLVVAVVAILVRFGPSSLDLLDLNQQQRTMERLAADREDMRELLELTNRDRAQSGLPPVTEDELRYGPGA